MSASVSDAVRLRQKPDDAGIPADRSLSVAAPPAGAFACPGPASSGALQQWLSAFSTCSKSASVPSSSHTVGPMRAAALFVESLRATNINWNRCGAIEVQLFGSLSATGIGHGSDNAVIMGLMGEWPDAIDPSQIGPRIQALRETHTLLLDGRLSVPFVWARDMRLIDENLPFHPNAMTIDCRGRSRRTASRHLLFGRRRFCRRSSAGLKRRGRSGSH
jgi:hypothetical protein